MSLGIALAIPLAFIATSRILQEIKEPIELSPSIFVAGAAIALLAATVSVLALVLRTARRNPTEALKISD